ncbi:MAG: hypothetical protein EOP47_24345 [Sphingobacteriaceae bacterium]|nr:MAG: hypothetical protein EOP47_24345 [Sphingobacteriaceae bacterium]
MLVSDKVGLAGYVADNKLGWICSTNAASISGTINDIGTKHAAALNEMSACAPVKIKEDFNNTKLVSKYIHLYNKTISNG